MYIKPHKIASNYPSPKVHSFTGNGARAGNSRRADKVRGFSETGYSYFGARYYDSDLSGLFLSVDPMADKYPMTQILPLHEPLLSGDKDGVATHIPTHKSHTQSALRAPQELVPYCAWNPVKLVDPDGKEFDPASQEIVNRFKDETVELMNSMDCTPEKRKEYDAALKEIAQLEKPGQMYHIQDIGSSYSREKGGIFYQAEDNSVCIEYDGRIGNLAHELKHAYQFEKGELSFSKDGKDFGVLYDITDEKAALTRGGAYDNKQYETLKHIGQSYRFRVNGDSKIDWYYPFLDKAPNKYCIVGHRSASRTV